MSKTTVIDQGDKLVVKIYEAGVTFSGPVTQPGSGGGTWYFGTADPDSGTGIDGDYFHRTDNDTIFGPKTVGAWGSAITLGGQDGANGKTILNGIVDPTSEGVDGDFYINTASNTLFGPKTSGAWGSGTSLVGPQGPTGAQGPQGDAGAQGVQGDTGPQGPQGEQGIQGIQGPAGNDGATGATGADGDDGATILHGTSNPTTEGVDGDYFLNTNSNDFFGPKTAGSWGSAIANFTGPQGPTGPGGSATQWRQASGVPSSGLGVDNDFYVDTDNWNVYQKQTGAYVQIGNIQGGVGATGPAGNDGNDGINGTNGSDGADGKTVLNGPDAPSGALGTDGDFYIDTTANAIYGPKANGLWGTPTNMIGPQGDDANVTNITINAQKQLVLEVTEQANITYDISPFIRLMVGDVEILRKGAGTNPASIETGDIVCFYDSANSNRKVEGEVKDGAVDVKAFDNGTKRYTNLKTYINITPSS